MWFVRENSILSFWWKMWFYSFGEKGDFCIKWITAISVVSIVENMISQFKLQLSITVWQIMRFWQENAHKEMQFCCFGQKCSFLFSQKNVILWLGRKLIIWWEMWFDRKTIWWFCVKMWFNGFNGKKCNLVFLLEILFWQFWRKNMFYDFDRKYVFVV